MICLFADGAAFIDGQFQRSQVLTANGKIEFIGDIDPQILMRTGLDVKIVDCAGQYLCPGLIDPHLHLSGGSGEGGGFFSQSLPILFHECIRGGVTTVVGTIGVDTTTKSMEDLIAKCKAFNELGATAFAYTGGYDIPPRTITSSVRSDLIFIKEIIGVGEIAIADHRAPEPCPLALARATIDSYVGGMLSGKPGIIHFHAGSGRRGLQSVRDLLDTQEIAPEKIYITHVSRNEKLAAEAIALAKQGCYVDIDSYDRDFSKWLKFFREHDAPMDRLTISSDAGGPCPDELWSELSTCTLEHSCSLETILPHFTQYTANALSLSNKGKIKVGADADIVVFNPDNFEISHVMANGNLLLENKDYKFKEQLKNRRGLSIYGIQQKN
jgi:beta-aspartyl-dipeptidase (metallo-type)